MFFHCRSRPPSPLALGAYRTRHQSQETSKSPRHLAIAFPEKRRPERKAIAMAHWENLGRVMAETMHDGPTAPTLPHRDRQSGDLRALSRQARSGHWRLLAHGELGTRHLAIDLCQGETRPGFIARSTSLTSMRICASSARTCFRAGCSAAARWRAITATISARRGFSRICPPRWTPRPHLRPLRSYRSPVPFFGKEARTQAIGAMIARRVGARIWMARCLRIGTQSRFKIEIKELGCRGRPTSPPTCSGS